MINKYTELHEQFMDLLAQYHNAHVKFISKPNAWNSNDLTPVTMQIAKLMREMKNNTSEMRKGMLAEIKAKKAAKLTKEK